MGKVILFLEKNTWVTILINLLCIDFHSCMQYFEQGITKNGYYYMKQENNSISRVYCEFEGMDQRYSRYLIVSSGNPWGDKNNQVEIVDISHPTKNCNLLEEIHPQEAYTDTGGLLGKNPVICRRNECMVFGTSIKTIAMKKRRSLFSAVSLNSSMLWLLGSDGRPSDDSTEFISLSEGRDVIAIYDIIKDSEDCRQFTT